VRVAELLLLGFGLAEDAEDDEEWEAFHDSTDSDGGESESDGGEDDFAAILFELAHEDLTRPNQGGDQPLPNRPVVGIADFSDNVLYGRI
jgi:hypothetical protein